MAQTLTNIVLHIVFSTKNRVPWPTCELGSEVYGMLGKLVKDTGCEVIIINGHVDHVHLLVRLSKNISLADLMKKIKGHSSKWIKTEYPEINDFYWQAGYFAFSADPNNLDAIIEYIRNQDMHHAKNSFKTECRLLFEKYNVQYDEKYCWD